MGLPKKTGNGAPSNFFKKVTVSSATFTATSDIVISFSTQGLMMLNEGTGVIEYSFNGVTVHGELDPALPNKGVAMDNIRVCPIWFRLKSGSTSVVSTTAWSIP